MPSAIVTGATGGLGYAAAEGLARAGHRVVLTGRNAQKGQAALSRLMHILPYSDASFALLDVADLGAIADFAARWQRPVRILINNAGVMGYRDRRVTVDGFEAQLGTNYLGHFALTLRLMPWLLAGEARVVNVASLAHRRGRIDFADLNAERAYSPWRAYAQSKLAMLMFALELQRRADAQGWPITGIAAHPGWSATDIVVNGQGRGLLGRIGQALFSAAGQSSAEGAKPILFAALDSAAKPGGYYGPAHLAETRGPTASARIMPQALDPAAAARLWSISEQLTGVTLAEAIP